MPRIVVAPLATGVPVMARLLQSEHVTGVRAPYGTTVNSVDMGEMLNDMADDSSLPAVWAGE